MPATLYTDGGARGNPGPAGIGYVLNIPPQAMITGSQSIGRATNNQAEYRAVIAGLTRAASEEIQELDVFLDSQLIVEQLNGAYRIKDRTLQSLASQVKQLAEKFTHLTFTYVPRTANALADKLVNEAIDKHDQIG